MKIVRLAPLVGLFFSLIIFPPCFADLKTDVETKSTLLAGKSGLDHPILDKALSIYYCAKREGLSNRKHLTIIDFTRPSNQKRLWIFDVDNNRIVLNTWVAHGVNSGELYARSFSNNSDSHKSSIGLYKSGSTYQGKSGYSMRLLGYSPGFNDNAYRRSVVMHGSWYVTQDFINKYGRAGRSWGCPAVGMNLVKSVIDVLKSGSLIVAFYPDKKWLSREHYNTCD